MSQLQRPPFRVQLKAAILTRGYQHMADFGKAAGISEAQLSQILNGWLWPTPHHINKLCSGLGMTQKQVEKLL